MPSIENPASQNAAIAALGTSEQAELPIENVVPCFTPGTVIATPSGEKRVEDLQLGAFRQTGRHELRNAVKIAVVAMVVAVREQPVRRLPIIGEVEGAADPDIGE